MPLPGNLEPLRPLGEGLTLPADLSSCESEPIHLLGGIEPNGVLLVVSEPALRILQVSSNSRLLFGVAPEDLIGTHLGDAVSPSEVDRLVSRSAGDGKRRYVRGLRPALGETEFDALVHRRQGLLMIECEPRSAIAPDIDGPDIFESLTDALAELEAPLCLVDLCQVVAMRVRRLTGFDRVMVYRFLKDDSGCVLSEDRREDLDPYLGLRYPASDIPAQARRLYLINTLRLTTDAAARKAVLVPAMNLTGGALDMTFCVLRAMSPVHIEYLRNMGVAASMSISIVKDGRLWGLIACHHGQAKLVPHPMRITCEVLARVFSSHIAAAQERDEQAHASGLFELSGRIEARLRADREVDATLGEMGKDMLIALGAEGCAFSIRGKVVSLGTTPDSKQVEALMTWLGVNQREHILATERLATIYPEAEEFRDTASGLLSVRVAMGGPDFVVWFRPAIVQVVTWAGNPEKPVEKTEASQRLSPRRSFEKWKQTFRDSSEPWMDGERRFAASLRPLIAETLLLHMNREIVRLNVELSRSNVELESFSYTASHDLQEPVRTIRAYAQLLKLRAGNELTQESRGLLTTIESSAGRMASLISALLSYSQLGGTDRRESKAVNLEQVLGWVLTNLNEQLRESSVIITHDELPVVWGDLDQMVELLQNLIGNSIKYRRLDVSPIIHISSQLQDASWLLSVRDNGEGFDPEHAERMFVAFKRLHGRDVPGNGIGLATCKRIVELHNGRIWAESIGENRGARVWFTLPGVRGEALASGAS